MRSAVRQRGLGATSTAWGSVRRPACPARRTRPGLRFPDGNRPNGGSDAGSDSPWSAGQYETYDPPGPKAQTGASRPSKTAWSTATIRRRRSVRFHGSILDSSRRPWRFVVRLVRVYPNGCQTSSTFWLIFGAVFAPHGAGIAALDSRRRVGDSEGLGSWGGGSAENSVQGGRAA